MLLPRLLCLAAGWLSPAAAGPPVSAEASKCKAKGLFAEARQDAVIPLCDENFPDVADSKSSWLLLFYTQDQNTEVGKYFDVQLNRIAMDFGNSAVRGKFSLKKKDKSRKQRKRIEFLADKYDFTGDLTLPKKGLSEAGPVLRVGGVCCDCEPASSRCPAEPGLHLKLLHGGKEATVEQDVRKIPETVRSVLEADSAGVLSELARRLRTTAARCPAGGMKSIFGLGAKEEVFLAVHGVSGSGVESFGPFVQAFAQAAMDRRGGSSAGIMLSCWRSEASWGGGEPPADGIPVDGILGVLVGEQSPRRRRGHPEAHETEVTVTFIMEDKAKSSSELVLTFATAEVAEEWAADLSALVHHVARKRLRS